MLTYKWSAQVRSETVGMLYVSLLLIIGGTLYVVLRIGASDDKWSIFRGYSHGRRLREGLGDGPPKNLRWTDGPCIRPPNISRSSVIESMAKYKLTKKRCQG